MLHFDQSPSQSGVDDFLSSQFPLSFNSSQDRSNIIIERERGPHASKHNIFDALMSSVGGPYFFPIRYNFDAVRITRLPLTITGVAMVISSSEFLPNSL